MLVPTALTCYPIILLELFSSFGYASLWCRLLSWPWRFGIGDQKFHVFVAIITICEFHSPCLPPPLKDILYIASVLAPLSRNRNRALVPIITFIFGVRHSKSPKHTLRHRRWSFPCPPHYMGLPPSQNLLYAQGVIGYIIET